MGIPLLLILVWCERDHRISIYSLMDLLDSVVVPRYMIRRLDDGDVLANI